MLLVLLVHSGFRTFGDVGAYDNSYWGIITLESFSIVCVNVFVLISGYFSIKFKWKSILRLLWICAFYKIISIGVSLVIHAPVAYKSIFVVSSSTWFIATYIGLICLSPILNAFSESASREKLGSVILGLLILQTWYDYIPRSINDFHYGCSILSFCVLYLIARYIHIYGMPKLFRKYGLTIYVGISLLISMTIMIAVNLSFHPRGVSDMLIRYSNPIVILSSIGLFAFFEKLELPSNKVINYIAASTLSVLLFHTSPYCARYVIPWFHELFWAHSGLYTILGWGIVIIGEFFAAIAIDQIRLLIEWGFKTLLGEKKKVVCI